MHHSKNIKLGVGAIYIKFQHRIPIGFPIYGYTSRKVSSFYDKLGRLNLLIFYSVPKVCRAPMTDWFNRKTLRQCAGAFTLSGISYRVHTSLLLKCFIIVCYCYNLEIMKITEKQFLLELRRLVLMEISRLVVLRSIAHNVCNDQAVKHRIRRNSVLW